MISIKINHTILWKTYLYVLILHSRYSSLFYSTISRRVFEKKKVLMKTEYEENIHADTKKIKKKQISLFENF